MRDGDKSASCLFASDKISRPATPPRDDEIVIRTHFAGVNMPDVAQRKGFYPAPKGASDVLGLEVSGEIVEVGGERGAWNEGDRVCALVNGGGYAEFCVAKKDHTIAVPHDVDMSQAACIPETFFTVWSNLFWSKGVGRMREKETLLIHGGAGGIGSMAIKVATHMKCDVIAVCGSEAKRTYCEDLGAALSIDYNQDDFVERLADTRGGAVDVVLDILGGDAVPNNLSLLKRGGRHISIGFLRGSKVKSTLDLLPLLSKGVVMSGSTLRRRPDEEKASILRDALERFAPLNDALDERERMMDLVRSVHSQPVRVFPMHDASEAHRLMESRELIGKIALDCRAEERAT